MFAQFRSELQTHGAGALERRTTLIDAAGSDELFYIPFEHVNPDARLVLIGITPGPTQLELAYAEAQRLLRAGSSERDVLIAAKRIGAFGGPSMRPNLVRMLKYFRIAQILGISNEEDLWDSASRHLHATSVVSHAAFRKGAMFAGSFAEVLVSKVFRTSFFEDFVPSVRQINPDAIYIALGPTPRAALEWCTVERILRKEQVLGALAHPSTSGGSQVGYYLREKTLADLKSRDPVRSRIQWLDEAHAELLATTGRLLGKPAFETSSTANLSSLDSLVRTHALRAVARLEPEVSSAISAETPGKGLYCVVKRGKNAGTELTPHVYQDGCYVVSLTRFEKDYIRVPRNERLTPWLTRGFKVRMSAGGIAPCLIAPGSIDGSEE